MLKPNISDTNAFLRLICGVTCTSFGTARLARQSNCKIGMMLTILGAMKIAEGIFEYCPIVALTEMNEKNSVAS